MTNSRVPSSAPHELHRERLLELLHRHRARPLILLVAPAGFGKSTLAATYARDSGAAVAWLALQTADRDCTRLFGELAASIEGVLGEPEALPNLRRGLAEGAQGVGLARLLLDDLTEAPGGLILALDDFHLVAESEEAVRAVDTLVRGLPDGTQLVITAREPPDLSMTRLVASGAVFPLGAEDLRFTPEETRALRAVLGGDPSQDELAEGWVTGILLGGAPRQLSAAGGSLLGSYFEREVLARLKPAERRWLETLSVLDTITPAAAERLLGTPSMTDPPAMPAQPGVPSEPVDGAGVWRARLQELTECCAFLVAGQDGRYHLHQLLRVTLQSHLRRSAPDRATRAWRVARQLAEEASDPAALVRACQELGELASAVEVVRRTALESFQTGRWPAVLLTLRLLPESERRVHPDLCLIEARALLNSGQPQEAREAAEAALQHGGRSGDVFVQISAIVELATISIFNDMPVVDDWLSAADHLLRRHELPEGQQRLLEGRALGIHGISAATRGDLAAAREAFGSAVRLLGLLGPSRDLALVQQNYGYFCSRIGDYLTSEQALAAAASHWRLMGDRNGLATTQIFLGELQLRLGNVDAAGAALHDALDAARSVGALRQEAAARSALGQWHRACGRIVDAVGAYDDAIQLAEEVVERELLAVTLVLRAEVAMLQDDPGTARTLLARAQAEAQRLGSTSALAAVDRALGRLHLLDGAAERGVRHLESALTRGGDGWGPDERVEALYWLGTAYLQLGRAQQASAHLEHAVVITEETGLPSLLARPAAEDSRLLQHGRQAGIRPAVLASVERQAATRQPWTGIRTAPPVAVVVHNELPRLEVQLFGSFVLHRNGQLVDKPGRKVDRPRELFALLTLHPKGLADDTIAEMIWPGMPPETALHNLQTAAYTLRGDLGSKAAVRFGAHTYQLNPQLELIADVRDFDDSLARARGATGEALVRALSHAIELYRGPLLADAAWSWVEPVRLDYQGRYIAAALQLAEALEHTDPARSDALAEAVLTYAPETDLAYERLIHNARQRGDATSTRLLLRRYEQAAAQFGFRVNPQVVSGSGQIVTRVGRAH